MLLLIIGLLLWMAVHLSTAMLPTHRTALIARFGEIPYKGIYALLIGSALALIIVGWQASTPQFFYFAPPAMRHVTMLLMLFTLILLVAAQMPTDIKRVIRHPQLLGVKIWAFAHLLSNGEQRSVLLFGCLLMWAVLEIIFINRRDKKWVKPEPVGMVRSCLPVVIGLVVYGLVFYFHAYIAGVALISH